MQSRYTLTNPTRLSSNIQIMPIQEWEKLKVTKSTVTIKKRTPCNSLFIRFKRPLFVCEKKVCKFCAFKTKRASSIALFLFVHFVSNYFCRPLTSYIYIFKYSGAFGRNLFFEQNDTFVPGNVFAHGSSFWHYIIIHRHKGKPFLYLLLLLFQTMLSFL